MNKYHLKDSTYDFVKQIDLIYDLILPYQTIINQEVLNSFPSSLENYPQDLILELSTLAEDDLFNFDSISDLTKLSSNSYKATLEQLNELISFPTQSFGDFVFNKHSQTGLNLKKMHEISKIGVMLQNLKDDFKFSQYIDIGGGVGNFARIMAYYLNLDVLTIDSDSQLQEIGQKEKKHYLRPKSAKDYKFLNWHIDQECLINEPPFNIQPDTFVVGLHTCGNLANYILNFVIKNSISGCLNFGCCYSKMTDSDQNLSNNKKTLVFNQYGLTLATRSHASISKLDYLKKLRVKEYRYLFHLFLIEHENIDKFVPIGESKPKDYQLDFSDFFQLKSKHIKLSKNYPNDLLFKYYNDKKNQTKVKQMIIADMIRSKFGRSIESFLLLDRAIYMIQNGYNVALNQFFDDKVSPRNIGLLAIRRG